MAPKGSSRWRQFVARAVVLSLGLKTEQIQLSASATTTEENSMHRVAPLTRWPGPSEKTVSEVVQGWLRLISALPCAAQLKSKVDNSEIEIF